MRPGALRARVQEPGRILFEVGIGAHLRIQHGAHQDGGSELSHRPAQVPSRVLEWIGVIVFQVIVETIRRWHRGNRTIRKRSRGRLCALVTLSGKHDQTAALLR
jgi:hypothetical protein